MHVIGTAGHVDHGKSTLVEALSGIHPDRLKEEREREMTIDLGFAWFTLPDGEEIGIVDVPGHRDFIENMLAGIGGIEAALFVIAADEGVMPQTREHLAILDLLEVTTGVVAMTKVDLVPDEEWLNLIEEDIRGVLAGTTLENAPIIRVSARSGEGLDDLAAALSKCFAERPAQTDSGKPRLPVDRVFTIAGFGTVVTGTLSDGSMRVGDEVEILPAGYKGRVRGLQTHKKKEETSVPGSRTAVNISGVTVEQVKRGDVVAYPGEYQATGRFDARIKLISDSSQPLKHDTEVKLFVGAAEVLARIRLLGVDELQPGQRGWIQIETKEPVVVVRGDRFILRRPSPGETIGGGEVVDPHPKGRHKRFAEQTIYRLESLSKGTPGEILYQSLLVLGPTTYKELVQNSHLDQQVAQSALSELVSTGQVILLGEQSQDKLENFSPTLITMLVCKGTLDLLASRAVSDVAHYHQAYPLKTGMPREELKSRMRVSPRVYSAVLQWMVENSQLEESGPVIRAPDHRIKFTPQQQIQIALLFSQFDAAPYAPPTIKDCQTMVSEDVYYALIDQGELIAVNQEVVFTRAVYDQMVQEVRNILQKQGEITAGEMRDHWNTSRRYVLAFLEHLDRQGITVREGDVRKLRK